MLPPPIPPVVPAEYHEGLAIDFPELDESGAGAAINVVKGTVTAKPSDPPLLWSNRFIRVAATVKPEALSIFLNSDLGPAGTYDVALRPTSRIWLRLMLSQREKPEHSEKPYEPVLDVSVRLLIDDGDGDGLARSQAGAWVTVACLPLLAGGKAFRPSDPVFVNVTEDPKPIVTPAPGTPAPGAQATGVRLTPFTAPVWCQFTQDVSTFEVKTTATAAAPQPCPGRHAYRHAQFEKRSAAQLRSRRCRAAAAATVHQVAGDGSQLANPVHCCGDPDRVHQRRLRPRP